MSPKHPKDGRQPPGARRERLVYTGVAAALVLVAAISVFFAALQRRSDGPGAESAERSTAVLPPAAPDELVLFYVAQNGLGLVAQQRRVTELAGQDPRARARLVAEQQLGDAPAPLASPFPEGTRVLAVYVTPTGDAFVDLSLEVSRGHRGGSLDELLTVYALVNALTVNVAEISAVQILVDGQEVDTLAGHVDLRRPLEANMKWVTGSSDARSQPDRDLAEAG